MAFKIARDIIEYEDVRRGMLGVEIASMTQDRARDLNMDRIEGVEILNVASGGSADDAGIQTGDVILKVGDHEVNEPNQLQARVAVLNPDEEVEVTLFRDGEELSKTLTLIDREHESITQWQEEQSPMPGDMYWEPQEDDMEVQEFEIGLEVARITPDEDIHQLIILRVLPDSPAEASGLQTELKILEADGTEVDSLSDLDGVFNQAMDSGDEISLLTENPQGDTEEFIISY